MVPAMMERSRAARVFPVSTFLPPRRRTRAPPEHPIDGVGGALFIGIEETRTMALFRIRPTRADIEIAECDFGRTPVQKSNRLPGS